MRLLLRKEVSPTDVRAPIAPAATARLVEAGWRVSVERNVARVFGDGEYGAAGCQLVEPESWTDSDPGTLVLGLGPLPGEPDRLGASYAHFSRLYSEPTGWRDEMRRFQRGGGRLYDLDSLTGKDGRKLVGLGRLAGWLGAAIGMGRLLGRQQRKPGPEQGLIPFESRDDLLELLSPLSRRAGHVSAVIVGANGDAGQGAVALMNQLGVTATLWDRAQTAEMAKYRRLRDALLGHDLLINCASPSETGANLVSLEDLGSRACRLRLVVDVTCDPDSPRNLLPIYTSPTEWETPIRALGMNGRGGLVEMAALENLTALLPRECSLACSDRLVTQLLNYPDGEPWRKASDAFDTALARAAGA